MFELKKFILILFSMVIVTQFGCTATGMSIGAANDNYDKFKDEYAEYVKVGNTVGLLATRKGEHGRRSYHLSLNAVTYGESSRYNEIVFLLDGQSLVLKGESKLTDVGVSAYSVRYYEFAAFPVTGSEIGRIGNASKVEVRVYGKERNSQSVIWDQQRISAVAKFYKLFVLGDWDRMTEEERASARNATWPSTVQN